jgi:hypothetical protein
MDMGPPKKPAPAAELKKLERMVGNWNWTGEMVSPTKEEMMKHMPPGSKEPQMTYAGTGKSEWALVARPSSPKALSTWGRGRR